jgi:hypothetical protein
MAANGTANHSPGLKSINIYLPGTNTSMMEPRIIPIIK